MSFEGLPYPVVKNPLGLFRTQSNLDQIRSDLLVLLLTNPGERIMLLNYGTGLRQLLFEQNSVVIQNQVKQLIINAINTWEPRVVINNISVTSNIDSSQLSATDDLSQTPYILGITISFYDPQNIQEVQNLVLELPLSS